MAGFSPLGLGSAAYSGLVGLFGVPKRSLAGFVADAVLEEMHSDEMQITDHPVQTGSVISDHAYKMPSEVTLTYGFSQSPTDFASAVDAITSVIDSFNSPTGSFSSAVTGTARINAIYKQLAALQTNRVVFRVVTGRRTYTNMMLKSLSLVTDRDTENAMIVRAVCRQVTFATVRSVPTLPKDSTSDPNVTGTPDSNGALSLVPVATP